MTDGSDDREVAADYLTAELVARRVNPLRVLWAVALTAIGAGEEASAYDLVVKRIGSGAEVIRTKADVGDPHYLLGQVQLDLEMKTVEEFLTEWRPAS